MTSTPNPFSAGREGELEATINESTIQSSPRRYLCCKSQKIATSTPNPPVSIPYPVRDRARDRLSPLAEKGNVKR
ncbi:MAG: hypothetical protein JW771_07000 [Candidatus Thermoplasmatota archaeon]|nr:hypothetical protein [Candidatus Thermoplasmatota archaeon]